MVICRKSSQPRISSIPNVDLASERSVEARKTTVSGAAVPGTAVSGAAASGTTTALVGGPVFVPRRQLSAAVRSLLPPQIEGLPQRGMANT